MRQLSEIYISSRSVGSLPVKGNVGLDMFAEVSVRNKVQKAKSQSSYHIAVREKRRDAEAVDAINNDATTRESIPTLESDQHSLSFQRHRTVTRDRTGGSATILLRLGSAIKYRERLRLL